MTDDSFILVSTKDAKSKKLAQVLTNDSCRAIIDYLGNKEDATESEIAKDLSLPLSTVHYNMKQLVEADLLTADEYHYSEKGKEVTHYRLAKKFIIIAPKSTFGWKQKLRSILPVVAIGAGLSVLLRFGPGLFTGAGPAGVAMDTEPMLQRSLEEGSGVMMATEAAPAPSLADAALADPQLSYAFFSDIALWFFFGVIVALALVLAFDWYRQHK